MAAAMTHDATQRFKEEHSHNHMNFEQNMSVFNVVISVFAVWIVLLFSIAMGLPCRVAKFCSKN